MHLGVVGTLPQARAIGFAEAAAVLLHGLVVQNAEHGQGGPFVLQNDGAGEQAVGKVQKDAQVVQVAAEVQGLGPVGFEVRRSRGTRSR